MFSFLFCVDTFCQAAQVKVTIGGIRENIGTINIGLFNSMEGFPDKDKKYKGVVLSANTMGVSHIFSNLPIGVYAIAVWHDQNEDGQLNKNILGVPKEKYGFSLNQYGKLGPPKYENVSFQLIEEQELILTILLH